MMASQTEIDQLKDVCNSIIIVLSNSILERQEWGEINFLSGEEEISQGHDLAKSWLFADLTILPSVHISNIKQSFSGFLNQLKQIQSFKIANSAESQRNQILLNIRNAVGQIVNLSAPWLPFLQIHAHGFEKYISLIEDQLNMIRIEIQNSIETKEAFVNDYQNKSVLFDVKIKNADEKLAKIDNKIQEVIGEAKNNAGGIIKDAELLSKHVKEETDNMLQDARAYMANKAIAPYTEFFEKTAKNLNATANRWLICTAFIILCTAIWAYVNMYASDALPSETPAIIRYFLARALVTGILITALYWTGKQYRICKHQNTINQHKADALKSFEAFIEVSNDRETRDAVLLQTTQTIFGQEPTGYLDSKETGTIEQYSKLISVARGAVNVASKN